jgi:hypothetical protein
MPRNGVLRSLPPAKHRNRFTLDAANQSNAMSDLTHSAEFEIPKAVGLRSITGVALFRSSMVSPIFVSSISSGVALNCCGSQSSRPTHACDSGSQMRPTPWGNRRALAMTNCKRSWSARAMLRQIRPQDVVGSEMARSHYRNRSPKLAGKKCWRRVILRNIGGPGRPYQQGHQFQQH